MKSFWDHSETPEIMDRLRLRGKKRSLVQDDIDQRNSVVSKLEDWVRDNEDTLISTSSSCTFTDLDPSLRFTLTEQDFMTQTLEKGRDVRSWSSFVYCAANGEAKTVWMLIKRGIDVEVVERDRNGRERNALEAAAEEGYLQIVDILLKHGATLNPEIANRETALQRAISSYRTDDEGSNLHHLPSSRGVARKFSKEQTVSLLLHRGADPNCYAGNSNYSFSPLQAAAEKGDVKIGEILLAAGAEVNAFHERHGSALHTAVERRKLVFVELLLKHDADVNLPASKAGSCLALAAARTSCNGYKSDEGLMQKLLGAGADVNIEGGEAGSVLQAAAGGCSIEMTEKLLRLGANVNARGSEQGSALHVAAYRGHDETVRLLLKYGADMDIPGHDSYGEHNRKLNSATALQVASFRGHLDVVERLVHFGARVRRDQKEWRSALAGVAGATPFVSGSTNSGSHREECRLKLMKELLDRGGLDNDEEAKGGSALWNACRFGSIDGAKMLLDHGARVNNGNPKHVVLDAALVSNNLEMVNLLLDRGADIAADMPDGRSAMGSAIHGFHLISYQEEAFENAKAIIDTLYARGAQVDDKQGSALLQAIMSGYVNMVKYILQLGAEVNLPGREEGALRLAIRVSGRLHIRTKMKELLRNHGAVGIDKKEKPLPIEDFDSKQFEKSESSEAGVLASKVLNMALGDPVSKLSLPSALNVDLSQLEQSFPSMEDIPYKQVRILGSGSVGTVDVVSVLNKGDEKEELFARKVFSLSPKAHLKEKQEVRAQNEIKIIQSLQNQHIVRFVATYKTPFQVGIIMTPVGDTDLASYLANIEQLSSLEKRTVSSWFGCLASGLSYLHTQGIRHKDIKPANLIVHNHNILYTDFNISRAFAVPAKHSRREVLDSDDEDYDRVISKSMGFSEKTPLYCAPEVAAETLRGRKADIFSLGCVFLELMTVLTGLNLKAFSNFRRQYPSSAYHATYRRTMKWLLMLVTEIIGEPALSSISITPSKTVPDAMALDGVLCQILNTGAIPLEWCFAMMQPIDTDRISAKNLLRVIRAWDLVSLQNGASSKHDDNDIVRHIGTCCSTSLSAEQTQGIEMSPAEIGIHLIQRWPVVSPVFKRDENYTDFDNFTSEQINDYCSYRRPKLSSQMT